MQTLGITGLLECLVYKVCIGNKTGYEVVMYRSPSQTYLEFQTFWTSLDIFLQKIQNFNPKFTIILGDFNVRLISWWLEDILSTEGNHTDSLTSMFDFHQVIFFFLNWDSLHARLNSHYKAWSYKKKKHKKIKAHKKSV